MICYTAICNGYTLRVPVSRSPQCFGICGLMLALPVRSESPEKSSCCLRSHSQVVVQVVTRSSCLLFLCFPDCTLLVFPPRRCWDFSCDSRTLVHRISCFSAWALALDAVVGRLSKLGEHGVASGLPNTASPYGEAGLGFFICEMGLRLQTGCKEQMNSGAESALEN